MTEALLVALTAGGSDRLSVISPTTTAPLLSGEDPLGELARRLDAAFIVSGGTREDGVTAFAQILRAPGGEHLWATVLPLGEPDATGREIAAAALAALAADQGFATSPAPPASRGSGSPGG